MKLSLRAKQLTQKLTLLSTAFVLAVSTLTASVPFILSQTASAVNPNCENEFNNSYRICVKTLAELNNALGNTQYSQIIINDTIETSAPILITRPLTLNGHDEKIKFIGDVDGWQGNYVVKVFNTTGVNINSLQLEGGDAALQVNVSEVNLSGNMGFANHEFGNIELTKSNDASLTRAPKLSVSSQGVLIGDKNTTADKPYVWVANNAVNDAVVSSFFIRGLNRTPNPANKAQHWYFTNPSLTGVVATNVTANKVNKVYASSQDAINDATSGDTVRLDVNETLQTALVINKAITFDGNNKVLSAAYAHTGTPSDNGKKNTVVVVASNNVTLKNLTTTNTTNGQKPHGIVVDYKTGIELTNVTFKNGRAGAILNGSQVTINGIRTENNSWYGINVDRAGAELSISGSNSHSEPAAIFTENPQLVTINTNGQYYVASSVGNKHVYVAGTLEAPVLTSETVYVNASEAFDLATWTHSGAGVHHYEYREYRNQADAATDNAYWTQKPVEKSQRVGQSWNGNVTLYYRVVAVDAAGNRSAASQLGRVVIDKYAPTAPVVTSQTGWVNSADKITWNASTDTSTPVTYSVLRSSTANVSTDGVKIAEDITGTSFDYDFAPGEHWIQVIAKDAAGNTTASAVQSVRVAGIPVVTSPKQNDTLSQADGTSFTTEWSGVYGVGGVKSYEVKYGIDRNGNGVIDSNEYATRTVSGAVLSNKQAFSTNFQGKMTVQVRAIYNERMVATDPLSDRGPWSALVSYSRDTVFELNEVAAIEVDEGASFVVSGTAGEPIASATATFAGSSYPVEINGNQWSVRIPANTLAPAEYTLDLFAEDAAGNEAHVPVIVTVKKVSAPSKDTSTSGGVTGGALRDEISGDPSDRRGDQVSRVPAFVSPGAIAGILGDSTEANGSGADNQDVRGVSTLEKAAQAVDADNTDGTAMGLAWYWWVLIAAGLALIGWWIAAAVRRRQAE